MIVDSPGRRDSVRCEFYRIWVDSTGVRRSDIAGNITVPRGPAFCALEAAMPGIEFTGRLDDDLLSLARNAEAK